VPRNGEERISLSACDPLNLAGILTPGQRVPALPQNRIGYLDGIPEIRGQDTQLAVPTRVA
jgi:ATP-dependent Lhr-like helicase